MIIWLVLKDASKDHMILQVKLPSHGVSIYNTQKAMMWDWEHRKVIASRSCLKGNCDRGDGLQVAKEIVTFYERELP